MKTSDREEVGADRGRAPGNLKTGNSKAALPFNSADQAAERPNGSARSGSPAPLEYREVSVSFGERLILDRVSLRVEAGETLALIGPSGAGKTTLFRLGLGFLKPQSGEVWVVGREISSLSERELFEVREQVGIVFQDGALFTSMTVGENVAFGVAEGAMPRAELRERVYQTLKSVGMEAFLDRMPDELSGGQAQRVAVARAIVAEPRVMFYDEPTQGLDPLRALDVCGQIRRLAQSGVASMVVTHQLEYARKYAHRIALLLNGRIVFNGSEEGLRRLDDPFVRSYFQVLEEGAPI